MTLRYDAVVIGGGPGGYVAGIRLGQLGIKTLVVEQESMGGVCLNWGCIPSKALIHAAHVAATMQHSSHMGISTPSVNIDIPKMQEWKNGIVKRLTTGVSGLVKGNGSDILMGTATLKSKDTIEVKTSDGKAEIVTATKAIMIATGATPIALPFLPQDKDVILSAKEAVSLNDAKGSMLVIGGGVIGMELGMVYQKLGMKVTVVEMLPQILNGTDPDLAKVVEKSFKKIGGEVLFKTKVTKAELIGDAKKGKKAKCTLQDEAGKDSVVEFDKVLVAVGFKPNSKGLGLESIGVALDDRGHIKVDNTFRTNVPNIYAIGDVTGGPYLAHKASKEAEIAAEVIAGHKAVKDWRVMPAAIFTEPQVATAGLSETEAKAQGRKVKIGKFPFAASGRAMAVDSTDGFVKMIIDEQTKEVLGVGIVGPEASDLISEAALAIEMCAFAEDIALTIHPHPTLGETMMEAAKHALGEAVHIPNR